jgi:hypothetical protein
MMPKADLVMQSDNVLELHGVLPRSRLRNTRKKLAFAKGISMKKATALLFSRFFFYDFACKTVQTAHSRMKTS